MPDINLLEDRETGENGRDERAKRERIVQLSNPEKQASANETPVKPAGGLGAMFKEAMEKIRKRFQPAQPIRKPRILTQELDMTPAPPPAAKKEGETKTIETYAPPIPEPAQTTPAVETAPPPLPPQEESAPDAVSVPAPVPYRAEPGSPSVTYSGGEQPLDRSPDLGVNLVPEDMVEGAGQQNRLVTLGLIAGGTILVMGLAFVGLSLFQSRIVQQTQEARDQISQIDIDLARLTQAKNDAIRFHDTTKKIVDLLDTHIYWTQFFAGLERHTVDAVFFRSFSADQAGRLTLSGSALDYQSVARQLVAFQQAADFVEEVSITSASRSQGEGGGTIEFAAGITLNPDIFFRDATGASVAEKKAATEATP